MNRREFLKRMAACGLVAATPKLIFDMGKNASKYSEDRVWISINGHGDWYAAVADLGSTGLNFVTFKSVPPYTDFNVLPDSVEVKFNLIPYA